MMCLPPALTAGTLLVAIPLLKELKLPVPSATAVLKATGAARTTAYKYKADIGAALPGLEHSPGRPPASPSPPSVAELMVQVQSQAFTWLADHPGGVTGSPERRVYADGYRHLVLDLYEQHKELTLEQLARVTLVALPTLKGWIRGETPQVKPPENLSGATRTPSLHQVETLLEAWEGWIGGFLAFCDHAQLHLRLPFSREVIREVLHAHGVRIPRRRGRWSPDASAQLGGFETFWPGCQWEGDGSELAVTINGVRYTCNLELVVDSHSDAFVGASVSPTEDSAAVVAAFTDGVTTTGDRPIAMLLDNKPSNHTEAVDEALGSTLRIRTRPYKPTDKPHVEGAFGLFKAEAPEMSISAGTPDELAQQIAALVATTWIRAANHRPMKRRGGKSRVGIYLGEKPSEEQVAAAEKALRERQRKQKRARETRARRQDPVAHAILDDAFRRLGLVDPERQQRIRIASWPIEAIVEGIAIFEGKRRAGTLPKGVDARYLVGIVRNVAQEREGMEIAEALLLARLEARDQMLDHLQLQRLELEDQELEPEDSIKETVDRALATRRRIDRLFWLTVVADTIQAKDPSTHKHLLRVAARRIHSTHKIPHRDRLSAASFLFAKVVPVA